MPTITGITFISPKTDKFQWNHANQFYINGTGLQGGTLTKLAGTYASGKAVVWSSISVLDNSSDTQMKVQATPSHNDIEDVKGTDPGDVTPTVNNGGSTVSNTVPSNYGT